MEKHVKTRVISKHETEANWSQAVNFIPFKGEHIVYDVDETHNYERLKIGDGVNHVWDLPFIDENIKIDWNDNNVIINQPYIKAGTGEFSTLESDGEASGDFSHSEGSYTFAFGYASHTEGSDTSALGSNAHAEGDFSNASGVCSHAEGSWTWAGGYASHSEGRDTSASGSGSHTEGNSTIAEGHDAHAEGENTYAGYTGYYWTNIDFNNKTIALSNTTKENSKISVDYEVGQKLTILDSTNKYDNITIVNINNNIVTVDDFPFDTIISNNVTQRRVYCLENLEGKGAIFGSGSHAEGDSTKAYGDFSHAEGSGSIAIGEVSHAEGQMSYAKGDYSHAGGLQTNAIGNATQAIGRGTVAGSMSFKVIAVNPEFLDEFFVEMTEEEYLYIKNILNPSTDNPIQYCAYLNYQYQGNIIDINKCIDYGYTEEDNIYALSLDMSFIRDDIGSTVKDSSYVVFMNNSEVGNSANGTGAHAEGYDTHAQGLASHTEGYNTNVYAKYGHAEGHTTQAGHAAHAEGQETIAYGQQSHAEGWATSAIGIRTHAEGSMTQARGEVSHAEGSGAKTGQKYFDITYVSLHDTNNNVYKIGLTRSQNWWINPTEYDIAKNDIYSVSRGSEKWIDRGTITAVDKDYVYVKDFPYTTLDSTWSNRFWILSKPDCGVKVMGNNTHAEGQDTIANGEVSHAENYKTQAAGNYAHAEGQETIARGEASHAEGLKTLAKGMNTHAEGNNTVADGASAHAEGSNTSVTGTASHVEGYKSQVEGNYSHAEGFSKVLANYGHAEGNSTTVSGDAAHAEGKSTVASGPQSHAEGSGTKATNWNTHAEGVRSVASGLYAHAEGTDTQAQGQNSHTEGENTIASNTAAHAEGAGTNATGSNAHSEGNKTTASGAYSHSENNSTIASGEASHAEGKQTQALGYQSHAEGNNTIASSGTWNQHVQGRFNSPMDNNYAHVVGNGTSDSDRRNAHTLDWNGNAWFAGNVTVGADKKKLATEDRVVALETKVDNLPTTPNNAGTKIETPDWVTDPELDWLRWGNVYLNPNTQLNVHMSGETYALKIQGFNTTTNSDIAPFWSLSLTLESSAYMNHSITLPNNIVWAMAEPVFDMGYYYYMMFIPFGNDKYLGTWIAKELS